VLGRRGPLDVAGFEDEHDGDEGSHAGDGQEPLDPRVVTGCHLPPGTSKWNKIEHRLFSHISTNWRGQPLVSLAVIVNLVGSTRTATGLRVRCELDRGAYPKGQDVTDAQMGEVLEPRVKARPVDRSPKLTHGVKGAGKPVAGNRPPSTSIRTASMETGITPSPRTADEGDLFTCCLMMAYSRGREQR
jgi:hypothetical protein